MLRLFKEQSESVNNLIENDLATKKDLNDGLKELKLHMIIIVGGMIATATTVILGVVVPLMLKIISSLPQP